MILIEFVSKLIVAITVSSILVDLCYRKEKIKDKTGTYGSDEEKSRVRETETLNYQPKVKGSIEKLCSEWAAFKTKVQQRKEQKRESVDIHNQIKLIKDVILQVTDRKLTMNTRSERPSPYEGVNKWVGSESRDQEPIKTTGTNLERLFTFRKGIKRFCNNAVTNKVRTDFLKIWRRMIYKSLKEILEREYGKNFPEGWISPEKIKINKAKIMEKLFMEQGEWMDIPYFDSERRIMEAWGLNIKVNLIKLVVASLDDKQLVTIKPEDDILKLISDTEEEVTIEDMEVIHVEIIEEGPELENKFRNEINEFIGKGNKKENIVNLAHVISKALKNENNLQPIIIDKKRYWLIFSGDNLELVREVNASIESDGLKYDLLKSTRILSSDGKKDYLPLKDIDPNDIYRKMIGFFMGTEELFYGTEEAYAWYEDYIGVLKRFPIMKNNIPTYRDVQEWNVPRIGQMIGWSIFQRYEATEEDGYIRTIFVRERPLIAREWRIMRSADKVELKKSISMRSLFGFQIRKEFN